MPIIRVPATTANLGAGFDTLGMALEIYNEVEFELTQGGLRIELCEGSDENIARNENNMVYKAVARGLEELGREVPGLRLCQRNDIPRTRGLGSSAACVVAGLRIADYISGGALPLMRQIELATEMEGHPDNILAALLGGLTVGCKGGDGQISYARIDPPENLYCCVMVPPYTVSTKQARAVLPASVPMEDAVYNISRAALMVAAMAQGDTSLLREASGDRLHQRQRARLIPRCERTVRHALEAGALCCFISGSGPTLIAMVEGRDETFLQEMRSFQQGFGWRIELVAPARKGIEIQEAGI